VPDVVQLRENGEAAFQRLSNDVAAALNASKLVTVEPWFDGRYRLTPGGRVGAISLGHGERTIEVRVAPKVGIARLLFLLGYAADPGWSDTSIAVADSDDLLPSIADAFCREAIRALTYGVLQGYRVVDEALPLIRGRILEGAQMTRRFGLPLPVEVRYDEYDADIPENQLLLAACVLAQNVPRLRETTRSQLQQIRWQLDGVTLLVPGAPQPEWRPTRLNEPYIDALRLATLLLNHLSVEVASQGANLPSASFVVSMWKVFEDFVTTALSEAMASAPGVTHTQHPVSLDVAGFVPMRPDLVHVSHGRAVAVVDAKYKYEHSDGYPNADAYQLLAYCTALQLRLGHLVYAKGNAQEREYDILQSPVTIRAHALDLSQQPHQLLGRIGLLADAILNHV
jgi:5-methylcytosine-specific restriction enzyme subunit McrC